MGDEKISMIAKEKWPTKLTSIFLASNCMTSKGLDLLSQKDWEKLETLDLGMKVNNLGNNHIDSKGLRSLKNFSSLTELGLSSNKITEMKFMN